LTKLEERKSAIIDTLTRLGRPIWVGDVATNAMEQEHHRKAFHALVEEGRIGKRPGPKGARVYYYLK
jgi:hypothetical protein